MQPLNGTAYIHCENIPQTSTMGRNEMKSNKDYKSKKKKKKKRTKQNKTQPKRVFAKHAPPHNSIAWVSNATKQLQPKEYAAS